MSKEFKYFASASIIIIVLGFTIISFINKSKTMQHIDPLEIQLPHDDELSSLNNATGWINSKPLKGSGLRGKVVVINFCTYTCINWLRSLPFVRSWAIKYKGQGLVVVGVHTPEFPFEKNIDNVRHAVMDMNIDYPVALDNDYTIWNAFNNQYWPALYFIDAKGNLRHQQAGEGDYEQSEKIIQQLLAEAGIKDIGKTFVPGNAQGIEVAADWNNLRSNENYLGYERTGNFSSPGNAKWDQQYSYKAPLKLVFNHWALSGNWTMKKNSIALNHADGRIIYSFHARDLHIVMGPVKPGTSVRFRVLIDGQPPAASHGIDVDDQGYGTISSQRLYQLIRQRNDIVDRKFEIVFFDTGVEAFAFTFG